MTDADRGAGRALRARAFATGSWPARRTGRRRWRRTTRTTSAATSTAGSRTSASSSSGRGRRSTRIASAPACTCARHRHRRAAASTGWAGCLPPVRSRHELRYGAALPRTELAAGRLELAPQPDTEDEGADRRDGRPGRQDEQHQHDRDVDVGQRILDDAGSQPVGRRRDAVAEQPERDRVRGQRAAAVARPSAMAVSLRVEALDRAGDPADGVRRAAERRCPEDADRSQHALEALEARAHADDRVGRRRHRGLGPVQRRVERCPRSSTRRGAPGRSRPASSSAAPPRSRPGRRRGSIRVLA